MHLLHEYLCQQLDDALEKRSIVVFYDPRREFQPFFDRELKEVGRGYGNLPRVFIGERLTFVARYTGSFFGVRAAVEPIAASEKPEPLIVYVPGAARDRHASVLMEMEKGGVCYEPQLRRLALNVLRKKFTDGQIDQILRSDTVSYDDIVAFIAQAETGTRASVLRILFANAPSEALVAEWLADEGKDGDIESKDARAELLKLIEVRLGLPLPGETGLAAAREKTLRYVLVGEFRSDLSCAPPVSVTMIPEPPAKECVDRVRDVAAMLRQKYAAQYVTLADRVSSELGLQRANIDATHLGNIDTFRFEERRLLAHAGELIVAKRYDEAAAIVVQRSRSFWLDRDVSRQSQWEACRLMAELGRETGRVRSAILQNGAGAEKWVAAYACDGGWHQVDALQRRLEAWVAKMDEEPETEKALSIIRREHEELLRKMADGFSKALAEAAWAVPGTLHQTRIYPDVVQTMGGPTAYFVVDALRFEMGADLAKQLQGAKDLSIRPAIAALPSITPIGMAALLPGASGSFGVVDQKGKLAVSVEGSVMPSLLERQKLLKAKVPDAIDFTLGKLLSTPPSKLGKLIGGSSLVVVRSQEIDFMGESDGDLLARQVMDTIVGNIARAVKKLATAGIENFVITGDHGHQFSIRKDEDMRTDNPGGDTLDIHRRCWVGRGGTTPTGTVRVTGAELGYHTDLEFVFPTGLGVFKAGGGLSFHHGGFSLQELVIPVISLRMPRAAARQDREALVVLGGVPDKVTNRTFGVVARVSEQGRLGVDVEPDVALKVILLAGHDQVGATGMAVGAEFDRVTGIVTVKPGTEASVGLMLTRDDCPTVRIVVLDPATDAVLAQTGDLPVKLGI